MARHVAAEHPAVHWWAPQLPPSPGEAMALVMEGIRDWPRDAMAVGDSPYDAIGAHRAGARAVGLLCGGFPRDALARAGCEAIYADPEDLLLRFEGSPLAPGEAHAGA